MAALATTALCACGSNDADNTANPTATAETSTFDGTATGDITGTYEVTMSDGTVVRQRINSDGTYSDTDLEGTETERGSWRQDGTLMCFDSEGSDPETCYAGGAPAEDGSFEMRDPGGNVTSTVRKIEVDSNTEMTSTE